MPDIDHIATGILIEGGVSPIVAASGSVIEEPQPQTPTKRHPVAVILAAVAAIITFILIRTF
jgi:hypothetical protein